MTNRELLDLAAKAAGIEIEWNVMINPHSPVLAPKTQQERSWLGHEHTPWNPLTDDGDALRLAVELLFEIDMDHGGIAIRHATGVKVLEVFNHDPYAAARLAIVRAAAAIGEKRP